MTDSSIPDAPAFVDALTPLERAALGLQDELSVFEIGLVTFHEKADYSKRKRLSDFLLQAIKTGRLAAYGDPDGWAVIEGHAPNHPRCDKHQGEIVPDYSQSGLSRRFRDPFNDTRPDPWTIRQKQYKGSCCLVTRANYLSFLATPAAVGIPKPDRWKAPQGEPALSASALLHGEPDKPESGAAGTQNPAMNRQCVADKTHFIKLATWQGTQQATVDQHPKAAYFKGEYDMPALLKWASEIDPRPRDRRGGRPRKS